MALQFTQRIDTGGTNKVIVGQATDRMGREIDPATVVTDLQIRMVIGLVRNLGHGIDKRHGLMEILEAKLAADGG